MGKIILEEQVTPSTPATDKIALYPKAGGGIYKKNDAGVEEQLAEVGSAIIIAHKDRHDPEDGGDPIDTAAASEITGVQVAAEGSSHSLARADHDHRVQHGIVDDHLVTIDQVDAASGEYARLTTNGIESRSIAETKADMGYITGTDLQPPAPVAFAGSSGHTITHNYGHTNYQISVNPVADPGGFLGEIWFAKSDNTVVVYNSGIASGNFDYVITPAS